jgi:hypothetical protein
MKGLMEQAVMEYRKGDTGLNAAFRTNNISNIVLKKLVEGGSISIFDHV